ncbi:MAG: NADH-quinone oxidoreductase subunit C [Bacteroidetes bacterium]|nr:NADH-quinone oxidoreductase subunit C [Bacteroidota bacterium]
MTNEDLKSLITQHVSEAVFEEGQFLNAIVDGSKAFSLLKSIRENPETEFDYLFCQSGVDWKEFFYVVYHLSSKKHKHTLVIKAKITDRVNPRIESVAGIWKTAEMNELEIFDLFGIKFNNHPNLRRLFLDDTWGFPLRKDYTDDVNIVSL